MRETAFINQEFYFVLSTILTALFDCKPMENISYGGNIKYQHNLLLIILSMDSHGMHLFSTPRTFG